MLLRDGVLVATLVLLTLGCGRLGFDPLEPLGPFSPPVAVAALDGGDGFGEGNPTATPDGLEMYFNRAGGGLGSRIFVTRRASTDAAWGTPTEVVELSSIGSVRDPELRPDGLEIHVTLQNVGNDDIYVSSRASRTSAWSVPTAVAELNSPANDGSAAHYDEGALVMDSIRGTSSDLWESRQSGGVWTVPTPMDDVNTSAEEGSPFVFQGGLRIVFDSDRPGTDGTEDLWLAGRETQSDPFEAAQPFELLNSSGEDSDAWISPDGRYMLMSSDRNGAFRIYESFR